MAEKPDPSASTLTDPELEDTAVADTTDDDVSMGSHDSLDSSTLSTDTTVTSLLKRLKSPQPSDLARKRKIGSNPPVGKKRGRGGSGSVSDPKSVSAADRVKMYPTEHFSVSNLKLFCLCCREELSLKKSSLQLHIKSLKHVRSKELLSLKQQRQADILKSLEKYDKEFHPAGETLPDSTRVFRVKVVTALLKAGVPLSKVDSFRDLFEETGYALCDSSHLRRLIPFILQDEISKLKQAIDGRHVAIIFDGTTHVCEAFVIVLRYVDGDWAIQQRVSVDASSQIDHRGRMCSPVDNCSIN